MPRFVAPPSGGSGYDAAVLADSPWGYWRQLETSGTSLADASGNSRNLTIQGAPTFAQTGPDGATADAIAWPDSSGATEYYASGTTVSTSACTAECWFYLAANPTNPTPLICTAASYGSNTQRIALHVNTVGNLGWMIYQGGATAVVILSASAVGLNTWHHVAASIGPAGMKIRLDKTTVATNAGTSISAGAESVFLRGGGSDNIDTGRQFVNASAVRIARPAFSTTQLSDARADPHFDAP